MSQWYKCKCSVCGNEIYQNRCEILQPEIFVCWNCTENAKQMLAIKKFSKEVNVKIDFGAIEKKEVEKVKDVIFGMEANNGNEKKMFE